MTTSKIEEVARAMFEDCMRRRYEDREQLPQWPPSRELVWEWRQHATAAIAAMRVPDEAMIEAGSLALWPDDLSSGANTVAAYTAMITAAEGSEG